MALMDQSEETTTHNRHVATGVRLSPQFVNRLCSRLETAHAMPEGVSGLLFGTSHEDVIVVQAFRSLMDSDIAAIEAGELTFDDAVAEVARAAEADPGLAPLDVLGWYSFRPLGGLHEADIAFHNRQFPSMPELALIVRRAEGGFLLFEFYANGQDGRLSEADHRWGASRFSPSQAISGPVEIALRASEGLADKPEEAIEDHTHQRENSLRRRNPFSILETDEDLTTETPARPKPRRRAINTGELPDVPAVLPSVKRSRLPLASSAIVFTGVAAAAGTFAFFAFNGGPSSGAGSFLRAILPNNGLNLRVEGQGDRVLLSWNRRNSIVRTASGAILRINDGPRSRDVQLDPAQVENGAVLYRPTSDDVSFRLEVHGQDGTAVAENLRVLDSGGPAQVPELTASTQPGTLVSAPVANIQVPHNWQPAPMTSKVGVPLPPPRLESPVPNEQKFDLNRFTASAPSPNSTSPSLPAAAPVTPPDIGNVPAQTSPISALAQNTATEPPPTLKQASDNSQSALPAQTTGSQSPSTNANQLASGNTPAPAPPKAALTAQNALGRYTPPKPIRQVLPDISELAPGVIDTTPEVDVIVMVDASGHVTRAQVEKRGRKAARALVAAAENAARQWVFDPARLDGRTVPSEHSIVFQFGGR
ncbi:MAG: energy transducer TonB [Acidobacteriaceae bacterium]|nr:energy transducer TonB [Acidobacteriaceae bacterium]